MIEKIIDENVSIADIKRYFTEHHTGPFFSMYEVGLNGCRFDLIRIDPYKQYVRIFEFKSCRADFISDKKWQKYLKYCHTFTLVCPRWVITPNNLPTGVGLLWIYKWQWERPESWPSKDHWWVAGEWKKKPRKRDVDKDALLELAFIMLYRIAGSRSNDVF